MIDGYVAHKGEMRSTYKILVWKYQAKKLQRPKIGREDNNKLDLKEIGCEKVDWIVWNTATNRENRKRCRHPLTSLATISSTSRRLLITLSHIFDSDTASFEVKESSILQEAIAMRWLVAGIWKLTAYRLKLGASGRTERKRVHISGADVHRKCG
jgi:hypothetical protein